MKKSKYQFFESVDSSRYLHYSALGNSFLLLNEDAHDLFERTKECESLESANEKLYRALVDNLFIVNDDVDECKHVLDTRRKMQDDNYMYNIVVNPTLDCNLSCWYCYEHRIEGSKIGKHVITAIEKNIAEHFKTIKYKCLKLSFFGGEPFICYNAIKSLLDYAKAFCIEKDIELVADFTTNATLITSEMVDYLKQFTCHFQITLDGGRQTHDRIKVDRTNPHSTYDRTLSALKLINDNIENHWLAVRVNFDNKTLHDIDKIIDDIDFLNRKKCFVILKKVWQLKTERVDKESLTNAHTSFFR